MTNTNIFRIRPEDFHPNMEVAACYLVHDGRLLLLKRSLKVPQAGTWGVPAGKMEEGESSLDGVIRETYEEIGFSLDKESLEEAGTLYVISSSSFNFHMFRLNLSFKPEITLSDEHTEYVWVTLKEALSLPLISGGADSLKAIFE
jgi:8-oxo-dGTP diphosphatase